MTEQPLLVFVFSETCGACVNFKKQILQGLLEEIGDLEFETVQIPGFSLPSTGVLETEGGEVHFHPKLNTKVEAFPSFLLMPKSMWTDKKSEFRPIVYDSSKGISKSKLLDWIKNTKLEPSNVDWSKYKRLPDGRYVVPTRGQRFS